MMRLLTLLVMLASAAAPGSLLAQQAADVEAGTPAAPQQQKPPAGKSAKPAGKPAATFNPSEKISADSAVSFPVDI